MALYLKLVGMKVEDLGSQLGKDASRRTSNRMKHRRKKIFYVRKGAEIGGKMAKKGK